MNKSNIAENLESVVSTSLMTRITEGLVRIEDIANDRRVYGGVTAEEKQAIKQALMLGKKDNIATDDLVESLVEYFRQHLNEIGPIMPVTGMGQSTIKPAAQTAAPGTQTQRPVTPAAAAANVAMSIQSMNQQDLEKGIGDYLKKDPNFAKTVNTSFANILANLAKGKK